MMLDFGQTPFLSNFEQFSTYLQLNNLLITQPVVAVEAPRLDCPKSK